MNKEEIVKRFMATYEPDTFLTNKHGVYLYYSQNGVSGINLESFFEDLVEYVLDLQTEQLKKQLEDKEKEVLAIRYESEKKYNHLERIRDLEAKKLRECLSQLSEKDKELSELKAKHEKDVKKAWQKGSESWIRGAQTAEQYYTQTHGQ